MKSELFEAEKSLLADKELGQPTCESDAAQPQEHTRVLPDAAIILIRSGAVLVPEARERRC